MAEPLAGRRGDSRQPTPLADSRSRADSLSRSLPPINNLPDPAAFVVTDIERPVGRQNKTDSPVPSADCVHRSAGEAGCEGLEGHRRIIVLERNVDDLVAILGQRGTM